MGEFLIEWLSAMWMVLVESGPYLLVGFVLAGLLGILVPAAWIARRLGGDDVRSVASASILGVPIPLCSCSVIPTATQLRRSGASKGATTSFLISTPETGVDSIGATWALMDPLMTVIRPVAAFATAFAAGISVNLFGRGAQAVETAPLDRPVFEGEQAPPANGGDGASCCHAQEHAEDDAHAGSAHGHENHEHDDHDHSHEAANAPLHQRVLRYAFGTLLDDLTPWFIVGFALSGLIIAALPDGFFDGALFSGTTSMLVMLLAGVPLYVCATASTPIAAAMMAKGLEPGAALVFLLAGPATNVATMLVVRDLLGKRTLAIYLGAIAVMSLVLGQVTNILYPALGFDPTAMDVTPGMMEHGPVATACGIVLALLLARSAWRLRLGKRFGRFLDRKLQPLGLRATAVPVKALAALVGLWAVLSTAITPVGPGESVFVERFGRVVAERTEPGRIVHAPWPLATPRRVPTGEVRSLTFGIDRTPIPDDVVDSAALRAENERLKRLEDEAEMMTGEGFFVSIEYAVQYRVEDARTWEFGFSEPEALVRMLAQESLRRATAVRTVEQLLVPGDAAFSDEVEVRLRRALEDIDLGASLASVEIQSAHAPAAVHREYRGVASAKVDAETEVIVAEWESNELLTTYRISAAEEIALATAEAEIALARSTGSVAYLEALVPLWTGAQTATRTVLILGAWRAALDATKSSSRRVIAVLSPFIELIHSKDAIPSAQLPSLSER